MIDDVATRAALKHARSEDAAVHGIDRWRMRLVTQKPTVAYLRALRAVEYWLHPSRGRGKKFMLPVARLRLALWSLATGLSIPPDTFGIGLCLPHYGSIVVNERAKFGAYCCLQNNVNIGALRDGVPKGGDFVYIAPGAVLYGSIDVGSRSVIGANSTLGSNVPPGVTYAGTPARQISANDSYALHSRYIQSLLRSNPN